MKQNLPKWYMIKLREANRFKEYERIPKIGQVETTGIHTGQFVICFALQRIFWLREINWYYQDFSLQNLNFIKKKSMFWNGKNRQNVYEIPERYKAKFKSGTVLNRACEAYGDYLKEEANNKDDEYEEGEEE